MYLLKELKKTITYASEPSNAFSTLVARLKEMNFDVAKQDLEKGEIVVPCLTSLMNFGVWRCWSDKLLFRVTKMEDGGSKVRVYAIPNLLRWRIRKGERVEDAGTVVSKLS